MMIKREIIPYIHTLSFSPVLKPQFSIRLFLHKVKGYVNLNNHSISLRPLP